MLLPPPNTTRSLYRDLLREAHRLPHNYLRTYYRERVRDSFRANTKVSDKPGLLESKLKSAQQKLRTLKNANAGQRYAFRRVLLLAYGRRGRLRHELLKPFLAESDPTLPIPDPIIPQIEHSRPPSYPPILKALMHSQHSRKTKPPTTESFDSPPALPARADPASEEARLLGPFSLRRKVNILWKFYDEETRRTYPPLEVRIENSPQSSNSPGAISPVYTTKNGSRLMAELEQLASIDPDVRPLPPKRQRRNPAPATNPPLITTPALPTETLAPLGTRSRRHVRRMYQSVLSMVPVVTIHPVSSTPNKGLSPEPKFTVSLSPNALAPGKAKRKEGRLSTSDAAWISRSLNSR